MTSIKQVTETSKPNKYSLLKEEIRQQRKLVARLKQKVEKWQDWDAQAIAF